MVRSRRPKVYGFPGTLCIGVYGYPWESGVRVQAGDLIKLDVAAEKDEFYADAALTIRAGRDGAETDAWVP